MRKPEEDERFALEALNTLIGPDDVSSGSDECAGVVSIALALGFVENFAEARGFFACFAVPER